MFHKLKNQKLKRESSSMNYELLKEAVSHSNALPLIIEMEKIVPNLIQDALITPLQEQFGQPVEKDSYGQRIPKAEDMFVALVKGCSDSEQKHIDYLYDRIKQANVQLSSYPITKLLASGNTNRYFNILKDYPEVVLSNIKTHIAYQLSNSNPVVFFIHKNSVDLAEVFYHKGEFSIDDLIPSMLLSHMDKMSQLLHRIDSSKNKEEYGVLLYEKMVDYCLNNKKDRYDSSGERLRVLEGFNFIDYFKKNMGTMSEDLILKSFKIAFKDEKSQKDINKITRMLKINKSSLEYSNFIIDALDDKTSLHNYKDDFYRFPETFWTKENLVGGKGNELSRGLKVMVDYLLNYSKWDYKSKDKVGEIYKKLSPFLNDIHTDFLNRRCFENKEYIEDKLNKMRDFYDRGGMFGSDQPLPLKPLEFNKDISFLKSYVKDADPNSEEGYQRIKNIIDYHLVKPSLDSSVINWISQDNEKGVRSSRNVNILQSIAIPTPLNVFEILKDYKDIIIEEIVKRDSAIDNNLVLSAMSFKMITQEEVASYGLKLTGSNLNNLQPNDKQSILNKKEYKQHEINSETIRHSLFYKNVFTSEEEKVVNLMLEYYLLNELAPKAESSTTHKPLRNKF